MVQLAGIDAKPAGQSVERLACMLWGPAGVGKTTLACTAPGKKLLMLFDPDGSASVAYRDDVDVVDLTSMGPAHLEKAKDSNPFGLREALNDYDTLIVDSITNFAQAAQSYAVTSGKAGRGVSLETPGIAAYGIRNLYTFMLIKNVLSVTAPLKKHVIFITHEGTADKNSEGSILEYPIALGGQLPSLVSNQLSEVWYVHDEGKQRKIMIRPGRMRKIMKTRMFTTSGEVEFPWRYNSDTGEGDGISEWFSAWVEGGCTKLPLPK
jgi:hypothetical protein